MKGSWKERICDGLKSAGFVGLLGFIVFMFVIGVLKEIGWVKWLWGL